MFYAKKLISALVLPPVGTILLALFGVRLSRRHPRTGRAIAAVALLAMLVLSLPLVGNVLMGSLEDHGPIQAKDLARAQAIVILGGGNNDGAPEYGGDTVGSASLVRLRYGVVLHKRTGLPVLVTGGAPYGGRPEGQTMKETAEHDFGIKIRWVEDASRDTAENAIYSAKLLHADGISRIALVTNAWHMARAVGPFQQQGLEVIPAPTAFLSRPSSLFAQLLPSLSAFDHSCEALHEWLGRFAQRLKS